jgi:phytoene dehydrogenase-like protein
VDHGDDFDVAIIGAGFGGLGAALSLAERGAKVVVLEALTYPGGCASTFTRKRHRFESGATLFSGFGEGQLFSTWQARHRWPLRFVSLDPIVELRAPGLSLAVPSTRDAWIDTLSALPGAPKKQLSAFFAEQRRVADVLWDLFADPGLLPPFTAAAFLTHLGRSPRYLTLLRHVGRSLLAMVERHGLADFSPLRVFLDGVCQITVQTSAAEAEAPFALATMDYFFRGTGHVQGGIGELARALATTVGELGGDVRFADKVTSLARTEGRWTLTTRRGEVRAKTVVANLLPQTVKKLAHLPDGPVDRLAARVEDGWGAAMWYLVVRPDAVAKRAPCHLELVADPSRPFTEGNHVFASVSGVDETDRSPDGNRTVTVSTHVPMRKLLAQDEAGRARYIGDVQTEMKATLAELAPELSAGIVWSMPGSPRTFERFTGRHEGYVGGVPRTVGLSHYLGLFPSPVADDLWLVGDSVFPGQSTLAAAIGGVKVADCILR